MPNSVYLRAVLFGLAFTIWGNPTGGFADATEVEYEDVSDLAEVARAAHGVPGLAVAAVVDGEIRAAGATGVRNLADASIGKIEIGDRFHIGSITKSITATLAATMVEEGRIRWESKPAEIFPVPDIHPGFRELTLVHLLSNSGGFPKDIPDPVLKSAWKARGDLKTIRLKFARTMFAREPEYAPGTAFTYSNSGFAVAGVMLESRFTESWEALVRKRIFEPLKMDAAGFRAPAADPRDASALRAQPWGHLANKGPVPPEPFGDNPYAIAPAGAVHCSVIDFAKYARYHLLGKPEPILKKAETLADLHRPRQKSYALGWFVAPRSWAGGDTLNHLGTNTMFHAAIWIAPEINFATVSVCNIGGEAGKKACDAAVSSMVERYINGVESK